jgi:hypothetical protein
MDFEFRGPGQQSCSGFLRLAVSLATSNLSLRPQLVRTWEVEPLVATRFPQNEAAFPEAIGHMLDISPYESVELTPP